MYESVHGFGVSTHKVVSVAASAMNSAQLLETKDSYHKIVGNFPQRVVLEMSKEKNIVRALFAGPQSKRIAQILQEFPFDHELKFGLAPAIIAIDLVGQDPIAKRVNFGFQSKSYDITRIPDEILVLEVDSEVVKNYRAVPRNERANHWDSSFMLETNLSDRDSWEQFDLDDERQVGTAKGAASGKVAVNLMVPPAAIADRLGTMRSSSVSGSKPSSSAPSQRERQEKTQAEEIAIFKGLEADANSAMNSLAHVWGEMKKLTRQRELRNSKERQEFRVKYLSILADLNKMKQTVDEFNNLLDERLKE